MRYWLRIHTLIDEFARLLGMRSMMILESRFGLHAY